MIRHFMQEDVLNVHVYGREGLAEAKTLIPRMVAAEDAPIREIVVKVHFARPEDVNGGDKLMSCMFAHSLTRIIAIVTADENQIQQVNLESGMLVRHGIRARAFKSVSELADWIEREFPADALACSL